MFISKNKKKILITKYNRRIEEIIKGQNDTIKLTSIYSDNYMFIDMSIQRESYTDKINNISIIELLDGEDDLDRLKNHKFLEFDDKMNDVKISKYEDKDIYIPYKIKDYPVGVIKSIKSDDEKKLIIKHNCNNIETETYYFPILLLNNYKMIGFNLDREKGIFLKDVLNEFEKKEKKIKNEEKKNKKRKEKENQTSEIVPINITDGENMINDNNNINEEIQKRIDKNKKQFINNIITIYTNRPKRDKNKNIIILLIEVRPEDIRKEIYFFDKNKDRKQGFLKEIEKRKNDIKIKIVKPDHKEEEEEELAFDNKFIPDIDGNYKIEIEFEGRINDCSYMFYGCSNIFYADLSNLDFTDVTNMTDMFNYCENIQEIKFNNMNSVNVDNMAYIFNYCKKLEKITNLNTFNTENVTNMAGMFQHCEALKEINISNFNTKNVTQLSCMFNDCYNLENIILPKDFSTDKLMLMPWMFFGCEKLKSIDLSSLKMDNVFDMNIMFGGCDNLNEIKVNANNNIFMSQYQQLKDKIKIIE